jgi:hypothetical protein
LWQFIDVANDLELVVRRCRGGARRGQEDVGVNLRVGIFKTLCARGEFDRKLPYHPAVRGPGYVPDCQKGSEEQFV